MANSHLASIQSGIRYNRELKRLLNSIIGTKEHPRGQMVAAYFRAKQALVGNVDNEAVIREVTTAYRQEVAEAARSGLLGAQQVGVAHATDMIRAYDLPLISRGELEFPAGDFAAIMAVVEQQNAAILSQRIPESQLLGSTSRVGLFAPGLLQLTASSRILNTAQTEVNDSLMPSLELAGAAGRWMKQAVAAIDERTTPCCLGVHGQVQEMDDDFYTPDGPAYADNQPRPPFHDWCRTSQVLVLKAQAADDLTRDMRRAALLEEKLRGRELYSAPHPANAFTRIRDGRGLTISGTTIPSSVTSLVNAELAAIEQQLANITFESIEEAELWFIDNFPGLEDITLGDMDLRMAERFAVHTQYLEQKYGLSGPHGIRQIHVRPLQGMVGAGRFSQAGGIVEFNPTLMASDDGYLKMMQEIGFGDDVGAIVPKSMEDIVTHEYGHALDSVNADLVQFGHREFSGFGDYYYPNWDGVEKYISRYALTDVSEFAAEAFVLYERGDLDALRKAGVGGVIDIFDGWAR